jgi:hypothetical protein
MNGMHHEQHWARTFGSDNYSFTGEYRLPPTPTLAQATLAGYFETDDQAHVDLGFSSCTYIDDSGVPRTDSFPDVDDVGATHVFGRNALTGASWEMRVSNCYAAVVLNFFFWDEVQ